MKEKLKQLLFITCLFIVFVLQDIKAYAYTIPDTSTGPVDVSMKADVPDGYTEKFEIAIYNEITGETIVKEFTTNNNYTNIVQLPNKCTYHFMMMFENEDYTSDIPESIELKEETTFDVSFIVTAREIPNNSPQADNGEIIGLENHTTHSEETNTSEYDENTGLKSADAIYNEFIEKTSFLKDSSTYNENFILVFCSAMEKEDYLNNASQGSEEKWNKMSDYDKFIYKMLYEKPYLEIVKKNKTYSSVDEFINKAFDIWTPEYLNSMIPNRGQEVRDALEEVWRWEYNYFKITGMFFDLYDYKYGTSDTPTIEVQQKLNEKEKEEQELAEAKEEIMNNLTEEEKKEIESALSEETEENDTSEGIKDHSGTIILIIVIIVLLAYIFINKKANKSIETQQKE